ncbi:ATP-binding protein [Chroogloeocystis siderophila]|jgi:PAS domain S-box-containing protein|uniref:Circadian input-output histidine kinase CikA n=1 Tax=Chroogloeocystis siderophila 5.2 s.c.1 TaxID=247279 RepID=A0A1U7HTR5_9CHRO|nr:ATP-binding protein [Chroogloeocystis siderophila]OKH26976.1 hybrid sensor histidine kinase/response regulator [Chroogloeocystis siderophila 5.2 s.c.1]
MPSEPKVNILMVDDHPENLLALEAILEGLGQNLVKAHSGMEALRCLLNQDFAVILLDVQMPDMDGFETAALIRQRARSHSTPIIFLTAFSTSDTLQIRGYSLGAVDYLFKPIQPEILTSKVSVFVELYQKTAQIERQAAELKKSEERFRRLSANSPVGIFLIDTSGQCTYMNSRCQVICGCTIEQITENWWQIIHLEERDRIFNEWSACFRSGQEYSNEFRIQAQDTLRWVHLRSSPMLCDKGEVIGYVGTLEDISDRKQAEAERSKLIYEQAARAEAEAANRMKDEFLAVLSHELRTPLNSILGWARLLRTRKFDEKTIAKALETIERNAKSQAQLIEDILDISRIIQGKLRLHLCPVNLIPIIEAAINAVRPAAEAKAIQLETYFDANANLVCADPERLQQVIWNLLTNAIKFTPEGGIVAVRLETIDAAYTQIHVQDTGIGISPEFLPYVFDTFRQGDSTTTRSHGGLGLGLGIVRHLVELHHGTVAVDSAGEGQGTTFTVTLPVLEKVPGAALESLPSLS